MKRATLFVLAAAAFAALAPARPADAKELAGVTMPETLSAGDKTLKLNGSASARRRSSRCTSAASTSRPRRRTPRRSSPPTTRRRSG